MINWRKVTLYIYDAFCENARELLKILMHLLFLMRSILHRSLKVLHLAFFRIR